MPLSFNGATAMKPWKSITETRGMAEARTLQWGHGDEAVEEEEVPGTEFLVGSFNGATAMKPWKRCTSRRSRSRRLLCFNGATAMKPWKRDRSAYYRDRSGRFNGATAMKPWKR